MPGLDADGCRAFVAACAAMGVTVKWFGGAPAGYTSAHRDWRYLRAQSLPRTDALLATLFDMRLPLTFTEADCAHLGAILVHAAAETVAQGEAA